MEELVNEIDLNWSIDKFLSSLITESNNLTESWKLYEIKANKSGFSFDEVSQLIDQIINANLEDRHSKKIINNLFPNEQLDPNLILKIISRLKNLKSSPDLLKLLLKWILIVWEVIKEKDVLEGYYSIIFHFIDYEFIRPYICIILHKLTRSHHVTRFRIKQVIELQTKFGYSTELTELLLTYKLYKPSEVQLTANQLKFHGSRLFRKYWEEDKIKKQKFFNLFNNWQLNKNYNFLRLNTLVETNINGTKRALVSTNILNLNLPTGKVLLETIKSKGELIENAHRLFFNPNLLINLNNEFIYELFKIQKNEEIFINLVHYCNYVLQNETNPKAIDQILAYCLEFCGYLGYVPNTLLSGIYSVLNSWNGLDYTDTLLPLLELLKPLEATELRQFLLDPLKKVFLTMDQFIKVKIMKLITNLYGNWAVLFKLEYHEIRKQPTEAIDSYKFKTLGSCENIKDFLSSIKLIYLWFEKLSLVVLQKYNFDFWMLHHIFNFFEIQSELWIRYQIPQLIIPSKFFLLFLTLIPHGMSLSRLATLLSNYRIASFEVNTINEKKTHNLYQYFETTVTQINLLNSITTDICNMLWRNKFFHKDEIARGLFINNNLIEKLVNLSTYSISLFNISNHLGFFNFEELDILLELLASYQVRLPTTINPNTPASVELFKYLPIETSVKQELYGKYRNLLMKAIERRGYTGLVNFLTTTIASLAQQ